VTARGLLLVALLSPVWAEAAPLPPGAATTGKAKRPMGTGVLNLNTATLDQIDALPGVSPKLAAAVVAERAVRPFGRTEDVMRVQGMSRKRFERLRPHLAVSGPSSFIPVKGRSRHAGPGSSARPPSAVAHPRVPAARGVSGPGTQSADH
jgi:competence protein ComEA